MLGKTMNSHFQKALPDHFKNCKFVETLSDDLKKMSQQNKRLLKGDNETIEMELSAGSLPQFQTKGDVKALFLGDDQEKIKQFKENESKDILILHKEIKEKGEKIWARYECEGKEFYLCTYGTASMWIYPEKHIQVSEEGREIYETIMQIGTYSSLSNVLGLSYLTFSSVGKDIAALTLAALLTRAINVIFFEQRIKIVIALTNEIMRRALDSGIRINLQAAYSMVGRTLMCLTSALTCIVIAYGLIAIYDFLNKNYCVFLYIQNWNSNHNWEVSDVYLDNVIIENEEKIIGSAYPKAISTYTPPPGFSPAQPMTEVANYRSFILMNHHTFLNGLGVALKLQPENSKTLGFNWFFDCPAISKSKQGLLNRPMDVNEFYKNKELYLTPLSVTKELDNMSGVSVVCDVSEKKRDDGADYTISININ